ncbi:aromatic-ring hydroxylase C-terminal domain-containing protein [Micromonospora saelicesensis]|uniref:aromatic-ring hydroxylase C-terminal domain-containing protein n=1 Tax=Micromonospora saelicesensis TaxID=285676 RepID=UPI0035A24B5B
MTMMSSRTRWIDTAAAAWTGRVNTVAARTDRVDVDALLIRPDGCVAWALNPRRHHAGACAGNLVRPTGLSAVLTVVSGALGMKSASDKRCDPSVGG